MCRVADGAERGDGGFAHERVDVPCRHLGECAAARARRVGPVARLELAERERSGFGDERIVVGKQAENAVDH